MRSLSYEGYTDDSVTVMIISCHSDTIKTTLDTLTKNIFF